MLNAGSIIKCCEINGIRNDSKYIDHINCMKEEEYDMRHLIDPKDLSVEETGDILALAERIRDNMPAYSEVAKGKKIATLFMNQVQGRDFHLRQPCLILVVL